MIYILPAFLSPAECDQIPQMFPRPSPAVIAAPGRREIRENVRRSQVSFAHDHTLEKRIRNFLDKVNARFFHFEIDGNEELQLTEYRAESEGGYDWHLDIGPGSANLRKLSASVQLTDPSEYEGGDLEIHGVEETDRSRGAIIVFPAYQMHRVAPVTRGVRRSLVMWATGPKPFR